MLLVEAEQTIDFILIEDPGRFASGSRRRPFDVLSLP